MNLQFHWPNVTWLSVALGAASTVLCWVWYGPLFGHLRRNTGRNTADVSDTPLRRWVAQALVHSMYFVGFALMAAVVPEVLGPAPKLNEVIQAGLIAAVGGAVGTYIWLTLTTEFQLPEVAVIAGYYAIILPMIVVIPGLFG